MPADPFDDGRPADLTPAQVAHVSAWLRKHADLLGLRDAVITVSPRPAAADATAASHLQDCTDHSVVALGKTFAESTPEQQRATLTHELLHLHFQPVTRMVDRLIEDELGKRAEGLISAAVSEVEERCIDRLAHGLAQLLEPFDLAQAGVA